MHDQYIRLQFAGFSLTFMRYFFAPSPPRKNDEIIEIGRSDYGTFYVKRRITEDYSKWEFETLISDESIRILDAMFWEYSFRVREKQKDPSPDLILTDCTRATTERAPRSRAIAPPPFDTVFTLEGEQKYVAYQAKFYVWFAQEPLYAKKDEKMGVTLSFIESRRKVPLTLDGV